MKGSFALAISPPDSQFTGALLAVRAWLHTNYCSASALYGLASRLPSSLL